MKPSGFLLRLVSLVGYPVFAAPPNPAQKPTGGLPCCICRAHNQQNRQNTLDPETPSPPPYWPGTESSTSALALCRAQVSTCLRLVQSAGSMLPLSRALEQQAGFRRVGTDPTGIVPAPTLTLRSLKAASVISGPQTLQEGQSVLQTHPHYKRKPLVEVPA